MEVKIRGKKTTFNKDVVGKLDFKGFKNMCLKMPSFISLPEKEREQKIKELYGKYFPNAKKVRESRPGSDIYADNVKSDRRDSGTKQSADGRGKDIPREKDKTEVQKQKVRSGKKETKS